MLQVLDGKISEKGILAPYAPQINGPLIRELRKYGIELKGEDISLIYGVGADR